jgi:hypothetical protein
VTDITLLGVTVTETAPTFLHSYLVPGGGDWSLHHGAAVVAEGVEGLRVEGCNFTRLGGNGLLVTGYARGTHGGAAPQLPAGKWQAPP